MDTPVLLIVFNRPKYVEKMMMALKKADVRNLYVFKDGPRPNNQDDYFASKEIETIISTIDWNCNIKTNYMQNNLGCGYGPFSAISWAFQYVNELIILEDDCIPTNAFFQFCTEMLDRYKDNERVNLISGRSQLKMPSVFNNSDYIFTQFAPTWGWATWKRVWKNFDIQLRNVKEIILHNQFKNVFSSERQAKFFMRRFMHDINDALIYTHIWDNQFGYYSRINGALRITPSKNLIKYIGLEGTHSSDGTLRFSDMSTDENFVVKKHPESVNSVKEYDDAYFKMFVEYPIALHDRIISRIKRIFLNMK